MNSFFITDYFEEKAKSSQIMEIHIYGSNGFLEPMFLLKYKELFPRIEKLTIDPKERYSGRILLDDYCDNMLWEDEVLWVKRNLFGSLSIQLNCLLETAQSGTLVTS